MSMFIQDSHSQNIVFYGNSLQINIIFFQHNLKVAGKLGTQN